MINIAAPALDALSHAIGFARAMATGTGFVVAYIDDYGTRRDAYFATLEQAVRWARGYRDHARNRDGRIILDAPDIA